MIVLDTSSVFREVTKDSLNMNPKLFQDENLVFNIVYFNDLTKTSMKLQFVAKCSNLNRKRLFKLDLLFYFEEYSSGWRVSFFPHYKLTYN